MGFFRLVTGLPGPSGFGSASTAEQVTAGIDASNLTVIITGPSILCSTSLTALLAFLTMQMSIQVENNLTCSYIFPLTIINEGFYPMQEVQAGSAQRPREFLRFEEHMSSLLQGT